MADRAHIETDEAIERMQRSIDKIYRDAQRTVSAELAKYAAKIRDKSTRLYDAIQNAETDKERKKAENAYRRFYAVEVKRDKAFKEAVASAAETLYTANKLAAAYINTNTPAVYAENYNYIGDGLEKDLVDYDLKFVSEDEADKYGRIEQQTVNKKKDTRWNTKNITRAVVAGAALMYGINRIFNGTARTVTERNRDGAHRQASDMATSAENKGRLDSMYRAYDEGFEVKKVWIATLDNRTRETHREYDGYGVQELDFEYAPGLKMPRDPDCTDMAEVCNCRCRLTYNTGRERSRTRAARDLDVMGSYKDPRSFAGTHTISVRNMSYEEWMRWRQR